MSFELSKQEQLPKFGADVSLILKLIRHGERNKEGKLLDLGRTITKERAQESGFSPEDFDMVKAIGSNAGPKGPTGMERSLETADIYAHEIAGENTLNTRVNESLSYETIISPAPYDHVAVYNSFLPENFNELSPEDKAIASKKAQTAVVDHVFNLTTPEAVAYRKEVAGAFAHVIQHYAEIAQNIESGKSALIPAGTHGGTMEFLLQQALVRRDKEGNETYGLVKPEDIGGEFDPSDSYDILIETDESGKLKQPFRVFFSNKNRPQNLEMYLDTKKVHELAEFYETLHDDSKATQ